MNQGLATLHYFALVKSAKVVTNLQEKCLELIIPLAAHPDHTVAFQCIYISSLLGAEDKLPQLLDSAGAIATWAGWLNNASYFSNKAGRIFDVMNMILLTDELRCALPQTLLQYKKSIESILKNGSDYDKQSFDKLLQNVFRHDCNHCNPDCIRDILVESGRTIQEIITLEPDTSNIANRFTWIARHVTDTGTCCTHNLGTALGLTGDEIQRLIDCGTTIPASIVVEMLNAWIERTHTQDEPDQRSKLLEALAAVDVICSPHSTGGPTSMV